MRFLSSQISSFHQLTLIIVLITSHIYYKLIVLHALVLDNLLHLITMYSKFSKRLIKPIISKKSVDLQQQLPFTRDRQTGVKIFAVFTMVYLSASLFVMNFRSISVLFTDELFVVKAVANNTYFLESILEKDSEIWLLEDANSVTDRIRFFNDALTLYRNKTLSKVIVQSANGTASMTIKHTVEYKFGLNYFKTLRTLDLSSHLTTFFIKWIENKSKESSNAMAEINENLPFTQFYRWTGVKPPCLWWDSAQRFVFDEPYCQPYEKFSLDNRISMNDIFNSSPGLIDSAYLQRYSREVDELSPKYAFFVHVARSATVTPEGNVYVKQVKIKTDSCNYDDINVKDFQSYDEIYSIATWAAHSIFHWMIDGISRMAVLLDFLRKNTSIRIHLKVRNKQIDEVFKFLGLDPDRIITGYAFGKIVYVPRATNCYEASPLDLQIMSAEYRKFTALTSNNTLRNSVVYIRRTNVRRFADNAQTENITKNLSEKYGLKFELFAEDNLPSVYETFYIFYRARVIVAPHGAGLLNMQYSRPGTVIIEASDVKNCPCFLVMAHILGHKYHLIGATGGKHIVNVNITDFKISVEFHLKYAAENESLFTLKDDVKNY